MICYCQKIVWHTNVNKDCLGISNMGIIISTVNMKGGVGKTTLTVNLATCLAQKHHKRVLVLDLDSQISATLSLLSPHDFAKLRKKKAYLKLFTR